MATTAQPLVRVRDVPASSIWYQAVLGATSHHGGAHYDQLVVDGELVLQLHDQAHEGEDGPAADDAVPHGAGIVLWFEVHDFDAAVKRIRALGAEVAQGSAERAWSRRQELWLVDPDGYRVAIAGPSPHRPRT